jgi:Uma2 family endonuclease
MAVATRIPIELYLGHSLDFETDPDYVDGELVERPMGEYDHATWQQAIQQWFLLHAKEWNIRVRPELRVQISPTRYRVADVVVFDRALPIEPYLTHPPIAVFEVLSPEDRINRVLVRLKDFEQIGIKTILVIDPDTQTIYRYLAGSLETSHESTLALEGSPCWIDWPSLRDLLD